jgi:hypothetical protein
MRTARWTIMCVLALAALGAGCESNNSQPADQSAATGGNGAFGEGTANPGEHSDQHFRNSVDSGALNVPTTQPSR